MSRARGRGSAADVATALAVLPLVAGCGGSSGAKRPRPVIVPTSARAADFPAPAGHSLAELQRSAPPGPVLAPSVSLLRRGHNRIGFALLRQDARPAPDAVVALYTASADGTHVQGPFPARRESLAVPPAFRSRTVADDPDAAKAVYVAQATFARPGRAQVLALAVTAGNTSTSSTILPVRVAATARGGPPGVGDRAISVHTPTAASAGGNLASIDTRVPPAPDLQRVDFAQVLGRRPAVLLFATPALCQSRVCGPVVDLAAQVQARLGRLVDFVHMEVYANNQVQDGFRPQVRAWRLPTEPWAFAVDRHGTIVARLEGAFSAAELEAAARRAAAA